MQSVKEYIVLLVEDDLGDQKLVKRSLSGSDFKHSIHIAENGEEALDYLRRSQEGDETSPRPDLILLDLNMPRMDGKEFLRRIKAVEDFTTIPVVILTTSDSDRDILEGYQLHASGYVKKPVDISEFKEVVCQINQYWFSTCKRVYV